MSHAIEATDIGKRYDLARAGKHHRKLIDAISSLPRAASQWLRNRKQEQQESTEFWALRGATFAVSQGEAIGIIGRNGAGKSTMLKVFSRITDPTEGRLRLRGRVASLLEVGTGFHPE